MKGAGASRGSSGAGPAALTAEAQLFENLVRARHSCKSFDPTQQVPMEIIHWLLEMTLVRAGRRGARGREAKGRLAQGGGAQHSSLDHPPTPTPSLQRSPSAYNMQPYRVVIMQDSAKKAALADAMLGGNPAKVLHSSFTAVFLADLQPARSVAEILQLEGEQGGKSSKYLRELEFNAQALLAGGAGGGAAGDCSSTTAPFAGTAGSGSRAGGPSLAAAAFAGKVFSTALQGAMAASSTGLQLMKQGVASSLSRAGVTLPTINSAEGWAFKNTGLAVQSFLMAATAQGLATGAMEGFDAHAVLRACSVPHREQARWAVPMVVSVGYPAAAAAAGVAGGCPAPAGVPVGEGEKAQGGAAGTSSSASASSAGGGAGAGAAASAGSGAQRHSPKSPRRGVREACRLDSFEQPFPA